MTGVEGIGMSFGVAYDAIYWYSRSFWSHISDMDVVEEKNKIDLFTKFPINFVPCGWEEKSVIYTCIILP